MLTRWSEMTAFVVAAVPAAGCTWRCNDAPEDGPYYNVALAAESKDDVIAAAADVGV